MEVMHISTINLKILFIALFIFGITGCAYTSVSVSSIGARTDKIDFRFYDETELLEGKVNKHKRLWYYTNSWALFNKGALVDIYKLRDSDYEVELDGNISFNINDIVWSTPKKGKVTILHNGEVKYFDVNKGDNTLYLSHEYREWYGYPAQTLLLVSVPFDIIIMAPVEIIATFSGLIFFVTTEIIR